MNESAGDSSLPWWQVPAYLHGPHHFVRNQIGRLVRKALQEDSLDYIFRPRKTFDIRDPQLLLSAFPLDELTPFTPYISFAAVAQGLAEGIDGIVDRSENAANFKRVLDEGIHHFWVVAGFAFDSSRLQPDIHSDYSEWNRDVLPHVARAVIDWQPELDWLDHRIDQQAHRFMKSCWSDELIRLLTRRGIGCAEAADWKSLTKQQRIEKADQWLSKHGWTATRRPPA